MSFFRNLKSSVAAFMVVLLTLGMAALFVPSASAEDSTQPPVAPVKTDDTSANTEVEESPAPVVEETEAPAPPKSDSNSGASEVEESPAPVVEETEAPAKTEVEESPAPVVEETEARAPPAQTKPTTFDPRIEKASWLVPESVGNPNGKTVDASFFPQPTLVGAVPCGRWSQKDEYLIDSKADDDVFKSLGDTLEWVNGKPEDYKIYKSHTFTYGGDCEPDVIYVVPDKPTKVDLCEPANGTVVDGVNIIADDELGTYTIDGNPAVDGFNPIAGTSAKVVFVPKKGVEIMEGADSEWTFEFTKDKCVVPPVKVFVCKYVGKPGVDERLQTGNNPISVSVNAIPDYQGPGSWFADAQGRSFVLEVDNGQPEPSITKCPAPDEPPVYVVPDSPSWVDLCEPANGTVVDGVNIPDADMGHYTINGEAVSAGFNPVAGTSAKVVFVPAENVEINEGSDSEWTHEFTKVACVVEVTVVAPNFTPGTCLAKGSVDAKDTDQYTWKVTGPENARVYTAVAAKGITLVGQIEWTFDVSQTPWTDAKCMPKFDVEKKCGYVKITYTNNSRWDRWPDYSFDGDTKQPTNYGSGPTWNVVKVASGQTKVIFEKTFPEDYGSGEPISVWFQDILGAERDIDTAKQTVSVETNCEPDIVYVVPDSPSWVDLCEPANGTVVDGVNIPDADMGHYTINGEAVSAGFNPVAGTSAKVVFVPAENVEINEGSDSEWTHEFTKVACVVPPVEKVATAPTSWDQCEPLQGTDDTVTIPADEFFIYKLDGVEKAAGTYSVMGTSATVTAYAKAGFTPKPDSKTEWTFEFTKVACEVPPVEITVTAPAFTKSTCTKLGVVTVEDTEAYTWVVTGPDSSKVYTAVLWSELDNVTLVGQTSWTFDLTKKTGESCDSDRGKESKTDPVVYSVNPGLAVGLAGLLGAFAAAAAAYVVRRRRTGIV